MWRLFSQLCNFLGKTNLDVQNIQSDSMMNVQGEEVYVFTGTVEILTWILTSSPRFKENAPENLTCPLRMSLWVTFLSSRGNRDSRLTKTGQMQNKNGLCGPMSLSFSCNILMIESDFCLDNMWWSNPASEPLEMCTNPSATLKWKTDG